MQYCIQQAIHMTEFGMNTKYSQPFKEECCQEHLLATLMTEDYFFINSDK